MQNLTARQEEVLSLIRNHLEETGYPPTRADIAKQLGFKSANAAEEHLKALAKKGAIEIIPGTSRGIKLANEAEGMRQRYQSEIDELDDEITRLRDDQRRLVDQNE